MVYSHCISKHIFVVHFLYTFFSWKVAKRNLYIYTLYFLDKLKCWSLDNIFHSNFILALLIVSRISILLFSPFFLCVEFQVYLWNCFYNWVSLCAIYLFFSNKRSKRLKVTQCIHLWSLIFIVSENKS